MNPPICARPASGRLPVSTADEDAGSPALSKYAPITAAHRLYCAQSASSTLLNIYGRGSRDGMNAEASWRFVREHRLVALGDQLLRLLGPNLIDRLAHLGHDVEAVEHVDGAAGFLGADPQVRFPHVRANELDARTLRSLPKNGRTAAASSRVAPDRSRVAADSLRRSDIQALDIDARAARRSRRCPIAVIPLSAGEPDPTGLPSAPSGTPSPSEDFRHLPSTTAASPTGPGTTP